MGKALGGCFNVFAWINNIFWGSLFIIAGIYALFWEHSFWLGAMFVGVGIYFFWTKSWTRKTVRVIAGEDPDQAESPAARLVGANAPSGSVSQRKTWIKNSFMFGALVFMVLGARALTVDEDNIGAYMVIYGGLAVASFFVYARIVVRRATEDALPALPWGAMIVAVLTAAFSPNTRQVSYTTPEAAAAAAERAELEGGVPAQPAVPIPPGSVTRRKLNIRNVILFAGLAVAVFGFQALKKDLDTPFLLLLIYGIPAAALLLLASRIRFDRQSEDVPATGRWAETISATLKGAVTARAKTGVQSVAQAPTAAEAPVAEETAAAVAACASEAEALGVVEGVPAVRGPSPLAPPTDAVRRNPKVLIIGVGAVVAVALVFYGGSVIKNRFFGPAAGTGLESRVASSIPGNPPNVVLTMLESVSDSSPKSVHLKEIDNEGSHDRFNVALRDTYHYSIDGNETDLETFLAYAKANISAECDIDYTSEGIWGLGMVGGGDAEVPTDSSGEAAAADVSATDAAPQEPAVTPLASDDPARHARQLVDLTAQARSDGAGSVEEIQFSTEQSEASGLVWFAPNDAPTEWYALDTTEIGDCYVDRQSVGAEQFLGAVVSGATYGMIGFNKDGVTEIRASTDPSGPTDGY